MTTISVQTIVNTVLIWENALILKKNNCYLLTTYPVPSYCAKCFLSIILFYLHINYGMKYYLSFSFYKQRN